MDEITTSSPAFAKPNVSGSVHITCGQTDRYRALYSNSKWFDECEWFSLIDNGNSLKIKKCLGIEIPKSAQKFTKSRHFQFVSEIPFGHFEFDEDESDIDVLVIHYR